MPTISLPLGQEAEIRGMTGREEDILTNRKKMQGGDAMDEILANCTKRIGDKTTIQPGDIERLKSPDRLGLLIAVRRETFGDIVNVDLQCPSCQNQWAVDVDLSQRPVKEAPKDLVLPAEVTLTVNDKPLIVRVDLMDGRKEKMVAKTTADVVTTAMLARIVEVEGVHKNDMRKWLQDLTMRARGQLRKLMGELDFGMETEVAAECPSCGDEVRFDVKQQPGFFFPKD
jgi:hypothetical protein